MSNYSKIEFGSYLLKGQLKEAVKYLSKFIDLKEQYDMYINTFERGQYYKRTDNIIIGEVDRIFQNYYRNVFWKSIPNEVAKTTLFQELWEFCGSKSDLPKDEKIEYEIAKLVNTEGYEYLGSDTQGYYGPYIWEKSTKETYEVELPSGIEPYTIIMMDGFISRSWLDFISFGKTGAGGWIGENGTLCCVRSVYDLESDRFNISFLKHEAQHAYDKKNYLNITSVDLEYRAKLVELVYWPNEDKVREIIREADNSNPNNSNL